MAREKTLRVQLLGGFSMYYGGEAVTFKKMGNSKSVRLLQILLLSFPNGISKNELIDILYGWNDSKVDTANSNKNLNNLIYRLKGQLMACGFPDADYVELNDGMCSFKAGMPIDIDTLTFEESVEKARECKEEPERMELLRRANEMYRGELLPANQTEIYFFHKSNHFKLLYVYTVQELVEEYLKKNDYKSCLALYERAAAIYPFDNWQVQLINCNLKLYRYDEALEIYNSTMELYAREMGTPPTAEMQECFEKLELIGASHRMSSDDVNDWRNMDKVFRGRKDDLKKAIFGEESVSGAYYCTYPSFVDYCRLVARAKGRNHFEAVLMFLTLSMKEGKGSRKQMDLSGEMQLLKTVLGSSLRVGDAYTRYGNRHYILMLTNIGKENCSFVFSRIESAYIKKGGKGALWYYADMTRELKEID